MTFLSDEEVASLKIEQSVFHIVGPGDEHFQLLEAFDASPHAEFFLGRVRSVTSGSSYEFQPDSPVRTQLDRIARNGKRFQEESENLARSFNQAHGGSSAVGAFLIFELMCKTGKLFALLKFEDEIVLSYAFTKGKSGKMLPTFGEIEKTFVKNRNALQKAALIRLGDSDSGDQICLIDRQNPQRPAAYFEQFLLARRHRTEEQLTATIVQLTRTVVEKHKNKLPSDTMKNLSQRLYNAAQSGGDVDGERAEDWLTSIVGPLPEDSPVLKDFRFHLKREGMDGESFGLQKGAIKAPRNRKIETSKGIKISFPADLQSSVIDVDTEKGQIIIRDNITINDIETERISRART